MLRGGEHDAPAYKGIGDAEAEEGERDFSGDELGHEDAELRERKRRERGKEMPAGDVPWGCSCGARE